MIAIALISTTTLVALVCLARFYLGSPIGGLIIGLLYSRQITTQISRNDSDSTRTLPTEQDRVIDFENMSKDIGGIIALFLSFIALFVKLAAAGVTDKTGQMPTWDVSRVVGALLKASVGGVLALAFLRIIVDVGGGFWGAVMDKEDGGMRGAMEK